MSPRLKRLSARQIVAVLERLGFEVVSQRGSHIKLRRMSSAGEKQTLTVPRHAEMDTGTIGAIFRQASKYVAEADLRPHFYSD